MESTGLRVLVEINESCKTHPQPIGPNRVESCIERNTLGLVVVSPYGWDRNEVNTEQIDSLVRRAQARDPEAYDQIVDLFGPRLYGYLFRLCGSREEAEDLLQELFLRVVRTLERYEHENQFDAWLFRIATNLVRDRMRRSRRAPRSLSLDALTTGRRNDEAPDYGWTDPVTVAPGRSVERDDEFDRLQRALRSLPHKEREAVMLRHFSQLSFPEVARVMGTPLGTALARVHRGLGKLRSLLGAEP